MDYSGLAVLAILLVGLAALWLRSLGTSEPMTATPQIFTADAPSGEAAPAAPTPTATAPPSPTATVPAPAATPSPDRSGPDFALADGWFFTQTSDDADRGFAVTNEDGILFWDAFQQLGGVDQVGYPISNRFEWEGFTTQVFQKMVLQWRPDQGRATVVNVMDLLHEQDQDEWLAEVHGIPPQADWSSDADRAWPEVLEAHLALLTDEDLRAAYNAADDPLHVYGLPMAPVQPMGDAVVLRLQRGALQKWQTDVPWARAGEITAANTGEIAKMAELFPASALQPTAAPR